MKKKLVPGLSIILVVFVLTGKWCADRFSESMLAAVGLLACIIIAMTTLIVLLGILQGKETEPGVLSIPPKTLLMTMIGGGETFCYSSKAMLFVVSVLGLLMTFALAFAANIFWTVAEEGWQSGASAAGQALLWILLLVAIYVPVAVKLIMEPLFDWEYTDRPKLKLVIAAAYFFGALPLVGQLLLPSDYAVSSTGPGLDVLLLHVAFFTTAGLLVGLVKGVRFLYWKVEEIELVQKIEKATCPLLVPEEPQQ